MGDFRGAFREMPYRGNVESLVYHLVDCKIVLISPKFLRDESVSDWVSPSSWVMGTMTCHFYGISGDDLCLRRIEYLSPTRACILLAKSLNFLFNHKK